MKIIKIIFVLILSLFLFAWEAVYSQQQKLPEKELAINALLNRISNSFKEKYKINVTSTNVSMPDGVIKLLGLDFQMIGPRSKEEIRKILIELAQEFSIYVNSDDKIKPFLEDYPFEIKMVEITLFFIDLNHRGLTDPYISIAGISRGKLDYWTLVKSNGVLAIKSEFEETYQEALEILKK